MTFGWPLMLLLLLAVPLLVTGYRELLRRRDSRRDQLAAMGLVAAAPAGGPGKPGQAGQAGRLRHLPAAFMLAALTLLLVATARPAASIAEPQRSGTVVLAFDVSNSMAATDLKPSRIEAAKAAARGFVAQQPETIKIAVVAFGESGVISQRPTTDRGTVLAAIDRLSPQGGTTIGRGIQTSLSAIAGRTVQLSDSAETDTSAGPDIGYYSSAAVVLLTDGENTGEPDPIRAAELASTAGVRVYPVGLGTAAGSVLDIDGFQVATALDEPVLEKIAQTTDGAYFAAADGRALTKVYSSIDLAWTVERNRIEVTGLFAAAAALLLLAGAGLSFAWFGRVI